MKSPSQLVFAVEGGGTKTDALLAASDGAELARVRGGPGNYQTIGSGAMSALLSDLSRELASKAGVDLAAIGVTSLAVAGCDSDGDRKALREIVHAAGLRGRVVVNNDARATLAGACGNEGVLVIAGTGSIAYGRNAAGHERRAGGWGHTFGDEGSAFDLGRQALCVASRAADGRRTSGLLSRRVLASLGVPENGDAREALVELIDRVGPIARLAPLVVAAAEEGDAAARGILEAGASALVEAVTAVVSGLGLESAAFRTALYGGLFTHARFYTETFQEMLRLVWPLASAELAPEDAGLRGALALGLPKRKEENE